MRKAKVVKRNLLVFMTIVLVHSTSAFGYDLQIGSFETDIQGTFVRLGPSSKLGERLTVYLFRERLFKRNVQGIRRGNIGTLQSFMDRLGKAPVLTLNIVLKPGTKTCSKESLLALVASFQQTESVPLGLTTEHQINIDIKSEDAPEYASITEFHCDLKIGGAFVLGIDRKFLFPSNPENVDDLIEDGDQPLKMAWKFRIDSPIEITK